MQTPNYVQVTPMPVMQRQPDLNCGYYCERSLLDYWYKRLNPRGFSHLHLKKTTFLQYDPVNSNQLDQVKQAIKRVNKPVSPQAWYNLLSSSGPVIVCGNLGGTDWGTWRLNLGYGINKKWKAGMGHFILIVGVDTAGTGTLFYKDPLQGDVIKSGTFPHIDKRLDSTVDYVENIDKAKEIFTALQTEGTPSPFH